MAGFLIEQNKICFMKRLLILLVLMGAGVWWMMMDKDKKEVKERGQLTKKKLKKTHFPKKEIVVE
jgi:preprotein translocase subunit YajC